VLAAECRSKVAFESLAVSELGDVTAALTAAVAVARSCLLA
jgi:hypothetical protein